MKFVIVGGTGSIGSNLIKHISSNHEIVILTRQESKRISSKIKQCHYGSKNIKEWTKELKGCNVLINLVGESIASIRWSKNKKDKILKSRLESIDTISKALDYINYTPDMIINASAIGYYKNSMEKLDESGSNGDNFLAFVVKKWEGLAFEKLESKTNKLVILRIGVVLDNNSGMLLQMLPFFKLGLGAITGNGKQFLSWIHINDISKSIIHIINNNLEGVINLVAPQPVSNYDFSKTLGRVLKKPMFLKIPSIVLKTILGEMSLLLLNSSNIYPKILLDSDYKFEFDNIDDALKDLIN